MADQVDLIDDEDILDLLAEGDEAAESEFDALKKRCQENKIDYEYEANEDFGDYATISLPSGRDKRRIVVFSAKRAKDLLKIGFENFRFIPGYEGIWNKDSNYAEIHLRPTRLSGDTLYRRLTKSDRKVTLSEISPIVLTSQETERPIIEIGPISESFGVISGTRPVSISVKFTGISATTSDILVSEILKYSNSLFLQIDMTIGSSFILERQRRSRPVSLVKRTDISLEYPLSAYNNDAMSLYWYAKTARSMPLLQFLAFYQSIEYYFPRYSLIESRKRASSIIKNPAFRPHRDDDLDKLISAIHGSRSVNFASERSQIRAALSECVDPDSLRDFLNENKERQSYFGDKSGAKKYHKIPLQNKEADLRNYVADRIYDIRCKIVHTKNEHSDDEARMILPFSDDADYLIPDIELVEFVARSVLIASSEAID